MDPKRRLVHRKKNLEYQKRYRQTISSTSHPKHPKNIKFTINYRNHSEKCRICLQKFIAIEQMIEITQNIADLFLSLTSSEVRN